MNNIHVIETLECLREKVLVPDTPYYDAVTIGIQALKQVDERPKGEWVKDYAHEEHGEAPTICSICSYSVWDESNFCPNCGADMRGGKNDK